MRKQISTGAPWESRVGYSRAVRVDNIIEISGTVSVKDGEPYAIGDAYQQTKRIFEIVADAIQELGGSMHDVIRTRMYVINIDASWDAIGKAHGEIFGEIRPAATMVEVSALIAPEYLVEIEVTALLQNSGDQ